MEEEKGRLSEVEMMDDTKPTVFSGHNNTDTYELIEIVAARTGSRQIGSQC